jgi:hypothetical protein
MAAGVETPRMVSRTNRPMLARCGQRMRRSWARVLTAIRVRTERAARFALERIAM